MTRVQPLEVRAPADYDSVFAPLAWQLSMLAVNLETSTQDLGEQANMLFEAHRLTG
jgi:hypothetical protein